MTINPKYRGSDCAVLFEFGGKRFGATFDIDYDRLTKRIEEARSWTNQGKGTFKPIKIYNGISLRETTHKITNAARDLENGKKVDLERLLE